MSKTTKAESENSSQLGYPELQDADFVYKALLGYGMFSHNLPPCFSSEAFFEHIRDKEVKKKPHCPVQYWELRHTNVPRGIGIPHPESYTHLCQTIKKYWHEINQHIGKVHPKKSFVHVRKITSDVFDSPHIFEMSGLDYGASKHEIQDRLQEYSVDAEYKVDADIAQCFPSIYSHSIEWAICGKTATKSNINQSPGQGLLEKCGKSLDEAIRCIKDNETNGLLIGPHTSNIVSEIILVQVDREMADKGHQSYVRYIDDYHFYAKDRENAEQFLRDLVNILKRYDLALNSAKVKITELPESIEETWINELKRFVFNKEEYTFGRIGNYLDAALHWAQKDGISSRIRWAMAKIAKIQLNARARRLYIQRAFHLCLCHPYLTPCIEKYVINKFYDPEESKGVFCRFVECLLDKGVKKNYASCVGFAFYFARKYDLSLKKENIPAVIEKLGDMRDCIALLLAMKYFNYANDNDSVSALTKKIKDGLNFEDKRAREQYWLLILEAFPELLNKKDDFLIDLKNNRISFLKWD